MKTVVKKEKQRNFGPDGGPNDPLTFALKFSNQLVARSHLSAWLREQLFFSQLKSNFFFMIFSILTIKEQGRKGLQSQECTTSL